ncbi:MAG: hypothetical protein K5644_01470 [Lachnospiraceae bacterium]|nr:hypothetical protein [Lachnospiraceae bacterium]
MRDRATDELNELLDNVKPKDIDKYLEENREYMADDKKAFYYYYKDVIDKKNIKLKDVYSFAGMSESMGGKIVRMEGHTSNRDVIIKLCIAGHFSLIETNRALKLYGMNELYSKNSRDACIIVAINNRIYDFDKIDKMLEEEQLKELY